MADILVRSTLQIIPSANTPDYCDLAPDGETWVAKPDYIINPDLSAVKDVHPDLWALDGDTVREKTTAEVAADEVAVLPAVKRQRETAMAAQMVAMVAQHYDAARQQMLTALLAEAAYKGENKRADYILTALGWIESVLAYFYAAEAAVEAAVDAKAVAAVEFDLMQFSNTDPRVTIQDALAL